MAWSVASHSPSSYFSTGGLVWSVIYKLLQVHVHGLVWLVCILAQVVWSGLYGLVCKLGTTLECSIPCLLLSTRSDIQILFLKPSEKRYETNTAGVYQFLTRARNNTNTRYSPLKAMDINPRLERETMDNTQMSLE